MAPLLALLCVTLFARLIAAMGPPRHQPWRWALRWGVAALFTVTASAHFFWYRADLIRMVPPAFGAPAFWVTLTGVAELVGAVGILIPSTRRVAALCMMLLLVAVFPANVYAAMHQIPFGGEAATPIVPRLLEQFVYLLCVAHAGVLKGNQGGSGEQRMPTRNRRSSHHGSMTRLHGRRVPAASHSTGTSMSSNESTQRHPDVA